MKSVEVKKVVNKKHSLEIHVNDKKLKNKKENYNFIMIERKSKDIIIIKDYIDLNKDNVLIFDNNVICNKIKEYKKCTFDLYLKSNLSGEKFILKVNNDIELDNKFRFIKTIIDIDNEISGYVYYTIKKEIAFQLTSSVEEALNKCNNLSYVLQSKDSQPMVMIKRNFNLSNLVLNDRKLELTFSDSIILEDANNIKAYLVSRENNERYEFIINENSIHNKNKLIIELDEFNKKYSMEKSRWDLFLEYIENDILAYGKVGMYYKKFKTKASKHLNYMQCKEGNVLVPYITDKNEVSILINTYQKYISEKYKHTLKVTDINMKSNKLIIKGNLKFKEDIKYKVDKGVLSLRNKTKDNLEYALKADYKFIENNKSEYILSININDYKYEQFYWDIYLIVNINGEEVKIRIKNPNHKVKSKINNKVIKFTFNLDEDYIIYPYVTMNNCLSLTFRQRGKYESTIYKIKEKIAEYIYRVFKYYLDNKEIWLIYEKFSETAQDNSFYFFKYCCENHTDKNIYYIITKDSKDYENVKKYKDKVLHFMSIKHLIYMCAAKLLIASESKGHSYAWRVQRGYVKAKLAKKKMVFLQHGVTALKRVDGVFKKSAANGVDLFVATSEYEKNIINQYFNYKEEEIIVTGFTRWDVLKDKSKDIENKEIFFMPTWRNWLDEVSEEEFEKSPYFVNYMGILNSKELSNILEKNGLTINYFVHPKFKYYIDKFSTTSDRIKIVQPGEVQVNELLMRASLLITDYSSVAWEMYYQNKPTLFYHFDIDDYNKYQGSYLDMENELFGDRAMNPTELVEEIKKYADSNFEHPEEFVKMREKYFAFVDDKNCERTFDIINSKKEYLYKTTTFKQKSIKKVKSNLLVKKIWKKIKTNEKIGQNAINLKNRLLNTKKEQKSYN